MSTSEEIRVWNANCQKHNAVQFMTDAVSNIAELLKAIEAARQNMWPSDNLPFELVFRGQDLGVSLMPSQILGQYKGLQRKLRKMLSVCRMAVGNTCTDHQVYFMMRHAGLPSHILDWSWQWAVALWFAIHDSDGKLKERPSSFWILRPILRDIQGGMVNGELVNPVFFPADQQTCKRSRRQDGCAYLIRFCENNGELTPVPMDRDLLYQDRLLEIPLTATMSCKNTEEQLLLIKPELSFLESDESPIPEEVVEECLQIFNCNLKEV